MRVIIDKLKAFWHVFLNSLTKPTYYNELLTTPAKFTFKYYFLLAVLLATLVAGATSIQFGPSAKKTVEEAIEKAVLLYPKDLVITIEEGALNINQEEPYFLKTSEEFGASEKDAESEEIIGNGELIENIIVFDKKGTIEDFENYKTLALVNEKNILIRGIDKMKVYPIENLPNTTIDYEDILYWSDLIGKVVEYVPYLVFLAGLVTYIGYYFVGRLIYVLFVAVAFVIAGLIGNKKKSFLDYYRVGIHTMTLPLIIEVLFVLTQFPVTILFWFFAVHVAFGVFVIGKLNNNK